MKRKSRRDDPATLAYSVKETTRIFGISRVNGSPPNCRRAASQSSKASASSSVFRNGGSTSRSVDGQAGRNKRIADQHDAEAPTQSGSTHLPCLFSLRGELPNAEICRRPVDGKTINHLVNIEDDMAIGIGRSRAQRLERRRQRIELVHELAANKKRISRAEIARRVGVSISTVYRDLRKEPPPTPRARRDLAAQQRVEQRHQRALRVRELQEQGLSQTVIAKRLGVSSWVVSNDLSDRPKKPWRRPELQERDRRARALYEKGMKVPQIALELGVNPSTIWNDLKPGHSRVGRRRAVEVRRLVARGVDKLKIAKRLELSASTVYRVPERAPHLAAAEIWAAGKGFARSGAQHRRDRAEAEDKSDNGKARPRNQRDGGASPAGGQTLARASARVEGDQAACSRCAQSPHCPAPEDGVAHDRSRRPRRESGYAGGDPA